MDDVMVTGRMSAEKKAAGNRVLERFGLNANQAVNLLFDKLDREQDAEWLMHPKPKPHEWESAAKLVDALHMPINSRFDNMTKAEIKRERLMAKGLM